MTHIPIDHDFPCDSAGRRLLALATVGILALLGHSAQADIVYGGNLRVNWERVGYPGAAARIAACSPRRIYALNTDKTLYFSNAGGADGTWQYLDKPLYADSIACDGNVLVAMNYDKTLYREVLTSSGGHYGWVYLGAAPAAATIGGGPHDVLALNFDQKVYISQGNDSTTWPAQSWFYRDTASIATRVAGAIDFSGNGRTFALNVDNSIWYSDQPGTWSSFPVGLPSGTNAVEISAASKTMIFALDATHHLWSATVGDTIVRDGNSYTFDWYPVGYPAGGLHTAAKVAACSPTKVYVLNTDKTLYVSYSGGADGIWYYMDTPTLADSIACDGPTLVAMNYDKTLYREALTSSGSHYGWIYLGSAGAADTIGGGAGVVTALNFDKAIYTSQGNDVTTFPAQSWHYTGSVAASAVRIAGTLGAYNAGRFFALNSDRSMYYTDGFEGLGAAAWKSYVSGLPPGVTAAEISAGSPNLLYVLDNNGLLWQATTQGLAVPIIAQQQTNWCWAAVTQMIVAFLSGVELQQCQLANVNTGHTQCCGDPLAAMDTGQCNQGGWWFDAFDSNGFTYASGQIGTALPFATLVNETNVWHRPVAFSWSWTAGGAHAMAVVGAFSLTVNYTTTQWVVVNNPEPVNVGSRYDQVYSDWVSGPGYTHELDTYQIVKH